MIELLNYYRNKVDNQENERFEWLAEIEQMKYNIENVHEKEDAILQIKHQMAELQKALSDSHLAIYDEKNQVNALRLDYEDLVKIEKSDVKRIRELEALNQDINDKKGSNKYSNFRDCRPDSSKNRIPLSKKEKALKMGSENKNTKNMMTRTLDSEKSTVS